MFVCYVMRIIQYHNKIVSNNRASALKPRQKINDNKCTNVIMAPLLDNYSDDTGTDLPVVSQSKEHDDRQNHFVQPLAVSKTRTTTA